MIDSLQDSLIENIANGLHEVYASDITKGVNFTPLTDAVDELRSNYPELAKVADNLHNGISEDVEEDHEGFELVAIYVMEQTLSLIKRGKHLASAVNLLTDLSNDISDLSTYASTYDFELDSFTVK